MERLLSVHTVCLVIGNYQLSWIELIGTLFYFASVFLISRRKISTWPVGIVSVILYGILFYQIQLYSDMLEQGYYLIISVIGWMMWNKQKKTEGAVGSLWSSPQGIGLAIVITLVGTSILAFCVSRFHLWLPSLFPEPASYPALDALTTVMSFVAMYLTTIRRTEGWVYWIIVDVLAVWLYWVKDVRFISAQYVFLLCMAIYGLYFWSKRKSA